MDRIKFYRSGKLLILAMSHCLATELQQLGQPWNPLVCGAIQLLLQPETMTRWRPKVLEYRYAARVLRNSRWYQPDKEELEYGLTPLGIVLDNILEVAIPEEEELKDQQEQRQLIPVAILSPGALFGAFEFLDRRAALPPCCPYEISAGSRTFKIVRRNGVNIRMPGGQFYKSLPEGLRKSWGKGLTGHDALISHYGLGRNWTAKVLFFLRTPRFFSFYEREFLEIVYEEAWRQLRHLRNGYQMWLRRDVTPRELVDSDARGVSKPLTTAICKFKRKLELAISEEYMVFSALSNLADLNLYGPIAELVEYINGCGEDPKIIKKKCTLRNKVRQEDVLVPMLLHDRASPGYLSLSDDAIIFQNEKSKKGLTIIQQQSKLVAQIIIPCCQVRIQSVAQSGKVDPFWSGAVQLLSRFPELPCLTALRASMGTHAFARCCLVMALDLREEIGSLIQTLLEIGGREFADRIFIIGKPYSSNVRVWQRIRNLGVHIEDITYKWKPGQFKQAWQTACEKFWTRVQEGLNTELGIEKIIILDYGGMLRQTIPRSIVQRQPVVGMEQDPFNTATFGGFPMIGIAWSAVKRRLEPSLIADFIWEKLRTSILEISLVQTIAVCGLGDIGSRLVRYLSDKLGSRSLLVWDDDVETLKNFQSQRVMKVQSQVQMIRKSDIIFGCTGYDSAQNWLGEIAEIQDKKTRYLINCSSEDIEFASLLRDPNTQFISAAVLFGFAKYEKHEGTIFLIPQAGFPIQFDYMPCGTSIEWTQLTAGILLAGLIQATELKQKGDLKIPLAAALQIIIVEAWRRATLRDDKNCQIREQSLKWWNPSPDRDENEFVVEHSAWKAGLRSPPQQFVDPTVCFD